VGKELHYANKHIVGGAAILTFGLWASKVINSFPDPCGFGSFTVTTIQGKGNKHISIISAYIAVQKGSDIGFDSLCAQQFFLYECNWLRSKNIPSHQFCPRMDAIRCLNDVILELQQKQHAIVLLLDANQSYDPLTLGNG
jgi:hypothetical protein